ncbi:MAG: 2OG-Fe(II) oxygenase [Candidatus Omnitrophica bacterium]|nr:2OG-Fe(II) oxygenase [Candidatus Omnitrophota bacterium]
MKSDDAVFERCCQLLSDNHYAVIDDFLSSREVTEVLAGLKHKFSQGKFKQARIGQMEEIQKDTNIRGDLIYWIDQKVTFAIMHRFMKYLESFRVYLNRYCFLNLKDYEMHYAIYPEGTYYKRHLDQFKKDDNRMLTFICYLNFNWKEEDGGALRLYLKDENDNENVMDIYPKAGRFVCFRSNLLEHEVLLTKRERYSLTGWFLNQKTDLKFLK